MRRGVGIIALVFVFALLGSGFVSAHEFQAYGHVTEVVDGDTVWFHPCYGYRVGETFKVRFADINAFNPYSWSMWVPL